MGGKARKPLLKRAKPRIQFYSDWGSPMPEAMALNAGATEALGPYAILWHQGPMPFSGQVFCLYHLLLSVGSAQRSL